MRRRLALVFCLLSFAALQVHSVIPHHHDHIQHKSPRDAAYNDVYDHRSPVSGDSHDAEFGRIIVEPEVLQCTAEKPVCITDHFFLVIEKIAAVTIPRPEPLCFDSRLYTSVLSPDISLRAPPMITFL